MRRAPRPGLVVISGWSHLFHDENVPFREAMRLLEATARSVRRLAERGTPFPWPPTRTGRTRRACGPWRPTWRGRPRP